MSTEQLSTPERYELEKQETVIASGIKTVLQVGEALQKIRDGRLYRQTHKTFSEYCEKKWGFIRQRAHQLIAAAETASNLSTTVDKRSKTPAKPKNERQIRPLAGLPKDTQKEAWSEATKNTDSPTEKQVAAAVEKVTAPKEKPTAKVIKDERGVAIPADKVALWNRRNEMSELASKISDVRVAIKKAQEKDDPLFAHVSHSGTIAALDQAYAAVSGSKPYCVCPMCQGAGCRACRKSGFMGRFQFKTFVPKELKKGDE